LFRILSLDEKVQIQLKDKKTLSSFREINGLVIEFNIDKRKAIKYFDWGNQGAAKTSFNDIKSHSY